MIRIAIIFLVLLASCKASKQKSSTSESSHTEEQSSHSALGVSEVLETSTAIERKVTTDSSETTIKIIPIGEFKVLPDGTFQGSAKSVETNRKSTKKEATSDSVSMQKSIKADTTKTAENKEVEDTQKEENRLNKETRPAISLWIGLGIFFIIVGLAFVLVKKFNLL